MKYSQSVCALNLFQAIDKLDKLVNDGMMHMHLDLMDFHYTESFGLNLESINYLVERYPNVEFDVHCMVDDIMKILHKLTQIKVKRISFPLDKASLKMVKKLKSLYQGFEFGVMIESHNQIARYQQILKSVDFVVLMTIDKIGGTGVLLNPDLLKKIEEIKQINKDLLIISDGGLRSNNIHLFNKAKVDIAVGGSIIDNYPNKQNTSFMDYWRREVE
ncbi:beta/alpha barrel domain-containing protein [Mycoplasmopsis lipofaciens]|uniref:hypothetical protein n=1 Tax=Mycoplasmopsis lipofaciens TaxID=114884 RepID=UPI000484748C|nr:hypothetical protein [Mycoplasmopsis lipofaciens]